MLRFLRAALVAFIIIHFVRRLLKVGTRGKGSPPFTRRPGQGPNEFPNEPPPPENPHLG